jgi:hypothetical protein
MRRSTCRGSTEEPPRPSVARQARPRAGPWPKRGPSKPMPQRPKYHNNADDNEEKEHRRERAALLSADNELHRHNSPYDGPDDK